MDQKNNKQKPDDRQFNPKAPTNQKIKQEQGTKPLNDSDHFVGAEVSYVSLEEASQVPADNFYIKSKTNYEELDEAINSMMDTLDNQKLVCKICGKNDFRDKCHLKQHSEAKHIEGVITLVISAQKHSD